MSNYPYRTTPVLANRVMPRPATIGAPTRDSTEDELEKKKWSFMDFGFIRPIGEGQYGKVFLVREKKSRKEVALKVMFIRRFIENNIADQLRSEIEIHSHLRHNRITRVYGAFIDKDRVGIVMEYAKYETLFNTMVKYGWSTGMPTVLIQQVVRQVYSALAYCHAHNIMHRDLKPENVLIFKINGEENFKPSPHTVIHSLDTKLTDFGWACQITTGKGMNYRKTLCGTVSYIAPEQNNAAGYSMEAETWSFGVLIYELIVGITEEQEEEAKLLRELAQSFANNNQGLNNSRFLANATPEARDLCQKLLRENPADRMKFEDIKFHPFFTKNYSAK